MLTELVSSLSFFVYLQYIVSLAKCKLFHVDCELGSLFEKIGCKQTKVKNSRAKSTNQNNYVTWQLSIFFYLWLSDLLHLAIQARFTFSSNKMRF